MDMKTVSVFFDTNIMECRDNNSLLSFSELKIPKTPFYDVIKFLDDYELWENVEILIPDMVVMELKHHLIKECKNSIATMSKDIQQYKDKLGCLAEIDCMLTLSYDKYIDYVDGLFEDFFTSTRNHSKIIEAKKDSATMQRLIEKATKTEAPFSTAGAKGKKYTDAGFKDAVIYETIVEYINKNDSFGILFTQDKDFGIGVPDFKLINVKPDNKSKAFEDFKDIIKSHFNILEQDDFETKLKDSYIKCRILEEAGLQYNDYSFVRTIPGSYHSDEENLYADIIIRVNNDKLILHVEYNRIANEISAEYVDQYEE